MVLVYISLITTKAKHPFIYILAVYISSLPIFPEGFFFLFICSLLEKEMATHSSILAGRIPWTEEPGGLQSMGLQSQT